MAPFVESLSFLRTQAGFAVYGMVVFISGVASAWIVIHWQIEPLMRFALWLLDWVAKLLGRRPTMPRLFVVIFCFNTAAMFVYMCTGVWVVLPALVGFLTGMNLAIIFAHGRPEWVDEDEDGVTTRVSVSEGDGLAEMSEPPPLRLLPLVCGLLVVVLELPAFWFSIGMGISLGHHVREHFGLMQILLFRFGEPGIGPQLVERCQAYVRVIAPVLAVSALAEAYAVSETSKIVSVSRGGEHDDDDL